MELTRQQKAERVVKLREQGLTFREIVEATGYSLSFLIRVSKEQKNGGIPLREISKMKTKELADKMAIDRITMRRYEVAEKYGLSESYVHKLLKDHPLKDKFLLVKRNKMGIVKQYTKEQWEEAVRLRRAGVRLEVIAEKLDMNLGTIRASKKMVLGVRERTPIKKREEIYNQVAKDRLTMSTEEVAKKYNKSKRWVTWVVNKRASQKPEEPYFYKKPEPKKPKEKPSDQKKLKQKKVGEPEPEEVQIIIKDRGPQRPVRINAKTVIYIPVDDKRTNEQIIKNYNKKYSL